ncbi:MAG: hypothetical protein R3F17_06265 [Planctomycetota bacterium]
MRVLFGCFGALFGLVTVLALSEEWILSFLGAVAGGALLPVLANASQRQLNRGHAHEVWDANNRLIVLADGTEFEVALRDVRDVGFHHMRPMHIRLDLRVACPTGTVVRFLPRGSMFTFYRVGNDLRKRCEAAWADRAVKD